MAKLNPWETDTSAAAFVQAVTTLSDAAWIMFQIADPNNTEQGRWQKITGANLKQAISPTPTVIIKSNIGTAYADISSHTFHDNDIVQVTLYEMQTGSERGTLAMTFKFSDLQTSQATTSSSEWSGQGARLQLVKSGKKIQAQIAGPVNASNKLIAIVIGTDPS